MVVDVGDMGVLLHLFLVNVASLKHEEEKFLKRWAFFLKAQYCHLTRGCKNAYSILATSPNAEGLKTNHHNSTVHSTHRTEWLTSAARSAELKVAKRGR